MIELPELVSRTVASWGADGQAWLDDLPGHRAELVNRWGLRIHGPALAGGTASYVAVATRQDGTRAVLKIAPPGPEFAQQVLTMARANGGGYALVYEYDLERNAVLLEELGPGLGEDDPDHVLEVAAAVLRQAWRVPLPDTVAVAPGQDKASQMLTSIFPFQTELGNPCSAGLLAQAREYAQRRAEAFTIADCVVVHGDPHPANLLAVKAPRPGAESGYVFVDPDGFLCEPAYDLGVAVRGWVEHVLAAHDPIALVRDYADRLSAATGVAAQAIWEWAFVERVTSGLFMMKYGHPQEGRAYLDSAERLVSDW